MTTLLHGILKTRIRLVRGPICRFRRVIVVLLPKIAAKHEPSRRIYNSFTRSPAVSWNAAVECLGNFIRKLREDVKRDGAGLSRSLSCGPAAGSSKHACLQDITSSAGVVRRTIARDFGEVPVPPQPAFSGQKLITFQSKTKARQKSDYKPMSYNIKSHLMLVKENTCRTE